MVERDAKTVTLANKMTVFGVEKTWTKGQQNRKIWEEN